MASAAMRPCSALKAWKVARLADDRHYPRPAGALSRDERFDSAVARSRGPGEATEDRIVANPVARNQNRVGRSNRPGWS